MSTTITLSKSIQAHGETVSQIDLREPTGRDLRTAGLPFRTDGQGGGSADTAVIAGYVSVLGGIPLSAVDQMAAVDFMAATAVVMGFFGAAPQPALSATGITN